MSTPENGSEMSPSPALTHGPGAPPSAGGSGSGFSPAPTPAAAPGTDQTKATEHVLLTPLVRRKLAEVHGTLQKDWGRRATNSEVINFLIDHWEGS